MPVEFPSGTGVTRDISIGGFYFETEEEISLGAEMDFTLLFSAGHSGAVACHGHVVRVDRLARGIGVAVSIEFIDLEFDKDIAFSSPVSVPSSAANH